MKFGDKLIALRKKNGLSQEELAAKLNVSRQSVSKWESNNSYPETDKIVQICNLFDCSMDDLINDNIKTIENIDRKSKNNINIVFDSFLEFITKTINMFCDMKFISGLKCIIEMIIMTFILFIGGLLFTNLFKDIILKLFSYLPNEGYYVLSNMLTGLLSILWLIFSIIVLVHIFKIRYLNYYDKILIQKVEQSEEDKSHKKEKINLEKKETVVIRDEKHRPFAFLSVCSKIIIFFIKFLIILLGLFFCASLIGFVVTLIISLSLSIYSMIFVGIDLALLSAIIINVLIILLFIYFVSDKKGNYKIMLIMFICSIFICGIGIGISIVSFKNIEIKEEISDIVKLTTKTESIEFNEDLVINPLYDNIEYVIDNNRKNVDIQIEYDTRINSYQINNHNYYGLNITDIHIFNSSNIKDLYNMIINDLKHNIIRTYYDERYTSIKIYASEDKINKIIDNTKKIYLVETKKTKQGYILYNFEDRIIDSSTCEIDYNVKTNIIKSYDNSCKCSSNEVNNKIQLICSYE